MTVDEEFVLKNQKSDLNCQKVLWLDLYARELTFFDLFLKSNKIDKKILYEDIKKSKFKLTREFVRSLDYEDTPDPKNYEGLLIEKLTNKIIIDTIKKGSYEDKKDFYIVKNLIKHLDKIKEEYRQKGIEVLNKYNKILEDTKTKEEKREARRQYKEELTQIVNTHKKIRWKYSKKQLKSRYRLWHKYYFLTMDIE